MPLLVFSEWCFVYEIRCFMLHLRREMLKKFMLLRKKGAWAVEEPELNRCQFKHQRLILVTVDY